jgi:hypothetical protein
MIEVDKGKQLLFLIRGGRTHWVVNTSTGTNERYDYTDTKTGEKGTDTAVTHNGNHRVYRVSDEARYESTLGILYRPRFIVGGVAVHGYSNVPRTTRVARMHPRHQLGDGHDLGGNFMPMGLRAWVHD